MNLFQYFTLIEANDNLHLGRILILLNVFTGANRNKSLDGFTKLAKLDFLLRYPNYLKRALQARTSREIDINIKDYESNSVESKMVRFKYGPWDFRYNRFIRVLIGKGLIKVKHEGKKVKFFLTPKGYEISTRITEDPNFEDMVRRSSLLKRFLDLSATHLVDFVYSTFPEIISLKLGEEIE